MNAPLVSVIIPCFNQGGFIGEAVASVRSQTVQDFELLIVDDGSTDEHTRRVLEAGNWSGASVFRTENRGLARARNFLIGKSTGQYLCALDADDRLDPRYLEKTLAALEQEPTLTFASSRLEMFGDEERTTPVDLSCDLPTLLCDCPLFPATLVRRDAVLDVGGYDVHIPGNEDWDLWITLLERGHRGVILPDVLFHYRRRRGSLCDTCTQGEVYRSHFRYLVRKHKQSFGTHLTEVMAWKARVLANEEQARDSAVADVARLNALVTSRSPERLGLLRPLDEPALRTEYARALAEIAALRDSVSWRLTAPLRAAYELLGSRIGKRDVSYPWVGLTGATNTRAPESATEIVGPLRTPLEAEAAPADEVEALLFARESMILAAREQRAELQSQAASLRQELLNRQVDVATGPSGSSAVDLGDLRRTAPISSVWGLDRGRPLDRYYIEAFLTRHRQDIRGRVLEVKDAGYTRLFGDDRVAASDVLDIDSANPRATIVADLAGSSRIAPATYDCFILTQTLGLIYDVRAALANAAAALKPGGVLLCTLPASGRISYEPPGLDGDYWRFTSASVRRLFASEFPETAFTVQGYGNVLARAAFEYGLADHEVSKQELDIVDPYFPVIYAVRAVRTWS